MGNGAFLTTLGLLLSMLQVVTLQAAQASGGLQTQFFTAIGAGIFDGTAFRTQFELMNEQPEVAEGQLDFFAAVGSSHEPEILHTWAGGEGSMDLSGSHVSFSIPPNSSLVMTLPPVEGGSLGWSRLETNGSIEARAVLQVAKLPTELQSSPSLDFEHYIQNVAEIEPVDGVKSMAFPIWLFEGLENISTAFAVVNLAGVPSEVRFTYRSGNNQTPLTRTVLLQSGEVLADYFDRFWPLGFSDIFPFEMRASAEVESAAPLGVTVFRTLAGLPVSGIKVIDKPKQSKRIEVTLGSEFDLDINQIGVIEAENLEIDFWNMAEDSRCPSDVVCVWEGRAVIELNLFHAVRGPHRLRLTTGSEGARFEDYLIKLLKVAPTPISTEKVEISDYRVTLIVAKE